jgi:hypothetical protein
MLAGSLRELVRRLAGRTGENLDIEVIRMEPEPFGVREKRT